MRWFWFFPLPLLSIDFTSTTLPQSIVIEGNRTDNITADRGNSQATVIARGKSKLNIQGRGNYVLNVKDPVGAIAGASTYYSGGFQIQGVQTKILNIHTLAIQQYGINLQNAGLTIQGSHKAINPNGTDYGGKSKVLFSDASPLNLQNSQASFTDFHFFIQNAKTKLDSLSKLRIQADTIRFQKELKNHGGIIELEGDVYNIGGVICLDSSCIQSQNSISSFESQESKILIKGNFYNGGQALTDTGNILDVFDPSFGGGGSVILRGGSMEVSGELRSQRGGTSIAGGELIDVKNSTLALYGAELKAKSINNSSQLTLGAYQNKLAKITSASFKNQGSILIDLSNFHQSGKYQLIDAAITTNSQVFLKNGNSEFMSSSLLYNSSNLWNGWVEIKFKGDELLKSSLTNNERAIFEALGSGVLTLEGINTQELKTASQHIQSSLIAQFFSPLETLALLEDQPNLDLPCSKQNLSLNLLQGGILGRLTGGIGGLKSQFNFALPKCSHISLDLTYAYANTQNQSTPNRIASIYSQLSSHLIALGSRIRGSPISRLNLGLNMVYLASLGELRGSVFSFDGTKDFTSPSRFHRFLFETWFMYDFLLPYKITLSPSLGLKQSYNKIPRFHNEGSMAWSGAYSGYQLSLPLGLNIAYTLAIDKKIGFDFELEQFLSKGSSLELQNTQGSKLTLEPPSNQRLKLKTSLEFSFPSLLLSLDARYQASFSKLETIHFLGSNISFLF